MTKAKSRQWAWQVRVREAGCCRICGQGRPKELGNHCRPCQDKRNAAKKIYLARRKNGSND